jgi:BirA family biotin operon repressor/biotin-[acetyl-CoA-carboxylase] ligase
LLAGRKVGGVLVEATPDKAVCGIGINLTWAPDGAAMLNQDRDALLERLRLEIERWASASPHEVLDSWRNLSDSLGRRVRVELPGGFLEGLATDVGPEGELVVDGKPVRFGSVTHL